MLQGWRVAALAALVAWMHVDLPVVEAVGDAARGLFPVDHENVTFLNDANFYQHVTGDAPWIVNFYSPMCSHCRSFAPAYVEIAAHFKASQPRVHVGAISCVDNLLCRRLDVNGYPQLVYFNFGKSGENRRGRGGSGPSSVYAAVKELFQAADALPPTKDDMIDSTVAPTSTPLPPLWTASLASTTFESRLLDAASAIVYGFKHELFAASEGNLSSDELAAFKQWLWMLQSTFPGRHNRAALKTLHDEVSARAELNMATWHALVDAWQSQPVATPTARSDDKTPPAWHELNRLFQTDGKSYRGCHGYTCGLWMVIHIAAHQAAGKSADDCVRIYQAIRGYVATFMTCETCRAHFVAANPPTLQTKSPAALQLWAFNMHGSVNARVRHPAFPSPAECPRCGAADNGAILRFLDGMYAYPDPTNDQASGDANNWITLVGVAAGVAGVGGVVLMLWWLRPPRGGRALPRFQKQRVA